MGYTDCAQSWTAGSQLFFVKPQGKHAGQYRLFVRHRYCRLLTCRTCGPDAFGNLLNSLRERVLDGTLRAVWTLTMRISDFSQAPHKHHKAFQSAFNRLKDRVEYRVQKNDSKARFSYFLSWASSGDGNLHAHVLVSHAIGSELKTMWEGCKGGQRIEEAVLDPATTDKAITYFNLKSLSEVARLFKDMNRRPYLCTQDLNIRRLPKTYSGPRHLRTTHGCLYGGRPYALKRTPRHLCMELGMPDIQGDPIYLHQVELPADTDLAKLDRLRPAFDRKGHGSAGLADKRFKPICAMYEPPGTEDRAIPKFDFDGYRRHIRDRMRHARELYVPKAKDVAASKYGSSQHDFPPFVGAHDAGDRLVGYLTMHGLKTCAFLPRFALLPAIDKIAESNHSLLLACRSGQVYRINHFAYGELQRQGRLLSEAGIQELGELHTGHIDLIAISALAVDPQHQRVVLLDCDITAAHLEALVDTHPGVRMHIHGGKPSQRYTRIATVVADSQVVRHTEPWMRDDVEIDVAFTPTRTFTYPTPSVGLRKRDGTPWVGTKFDYWHKAEPTQQ